MKHLFLWIFLAFSFKGYTQNDTLKIERNYWDNGKFKSVKVYSDLYYYSYTYWYRNGQKLAEGLFTEKIIITNSWDTLGNKLVVDGEGYQINFYDNGAKKETGIVHNGLPSGIWSEYYQNGQKKAQGPYKVDDGYDQGRKYGLWKFWDDKGAKTEERKYTNDFFEYWNGWDSIGKQILKHGVGYLEEYYPNHKIKAAGEIKSGKRWGNWREWYSNGRIREEYKYEAWPTGDSDTAFYKFVLINSWDSTNFQTAKNGTGWHYEYNDLDQLTYKSFYINGIRDGLSISYYSNGKQFVVDKYNKGNWTYRTIYHDNGNKAYEYNRAFGYNRDGIVQTWYYNGKLKLEELYNQGRLMDKTKYDKTGKKAFEFKN
jgi:antitoxin component YwqK of YwqJK toxin-antitoxin module